MLDSSKDWQIFFWIGSKAHLDKKASAAIHAVNLRNFLGAAATSQREEQNDESFEFMKLFNNTIHVIPGKRERERKKLKERKG
jgi:hypothetical protein